MSIELDSEAPQKQKLNRPVDREIAAVGLFDRFSSYPSKNLTPEKLVSILAEADSGDVYRQMELFEEVLQKDTRLLALFQARRLAVSGKEYNILPGDPENSRSVELANEVATMIANVKGWNNVINDQLDCVPKGYSLLEIFWASDGAQWDIAKIRHRHQKKIRFGKPTDHSGDPEEMRLLVDPTKIEPLRGLVPDSELSGSHTDGISFDTNPMLRRRFLITICKASSGNPASTSLLRPLTYLYMFKNFDVKWWIQFAERMLGIVIGKYDSNLPDQKELLERAVTSLSSDTAAVISNTSSIEFVEWMQKAASHEIFGDLKDWVNSEYATLILGHTGTSESTPGKLGSEDAAKEVKQELVEADAKVIDEAITDDIIVPWLLFNHGEIPEEEIPYYKTNVEPPEDLNAKANLVKTVQQMGYPVGKKYINETFGIPPVDPDDDEDELLVPSSTPMEPEVARDRNVLVGAGKKKLLTQRR